MSAFLRFVNRSPAGRLQGVRGHPGDHQRACVHVRLVGAVIAGLAAGLVSPGLNAQPPGAPVVDAHAEMALPPPRTQGQLSLEGALALRRSLRSFAATPLTAAEVGQLLWAAQGITGDKNLRTAPSAGATYPLVLYLVAGRVDGVATGVHRYLPQGHRLTALDKGDVRPAIVAAAHQQAWMGDAPALVLIAAQSARTIARYGARTERYVAIEAGAAAQNLLLQAVALGLGGTLVGAIDETALQRVVSLSEGEQVIAIIPVGRPRGND
jgi:SagB-type dehydrogenase family enzyme